MHEVQTGSVVAGKYRIEQLIGQGGLSKVYRATQLQTGAPVAIKVLATETGLIDQASSRFLREGKLLASIANDAVVALRDQVVTDSGQVALVMELMDGYTLERLLVPGPLSPDQVAELGLRLSSGLQALHALGIVHGDVKPDNVFVPGGQVARAKLGDLGLAETTSRATQLTMSGVVVGTPLYMSPEAARGEARSAASDIWSLGVVLYQCAYGRRPFEGEGPLAVLRAIALEDVQLPPLPGGLERVLERALQKNPSERFHSIEELARALTAYRVRALPASIGPLAPSVAAYGLPAAGAPSLMRVDDHVHASVALGYPAEPAAPARTPLALLGALVLSAIALAAFVAIGGRPVLHGASPVARISVSAALSVLFGTSVAVIARSAIGLIERKLHSAGTHIARSTDRVLQARTRDVLSQSIAIALESLLVRSSGDPTIDLRRASLALAIEDFESAKDRGDQRAALDRAIEIADKLQSQVKANAAPWFVRHKEGIAVVTALLGTALALISKLLEIVR